MTLTTKLLGNWAAFGTCAQAGAPAPDEFFPEDEDGRPSEVFSDEVRAACFRCPVREDCLTYAIEHKEPAGIWGGKTPSERKKLAVRRQAMERGVA